MTASYRMTHEGWDADRAFQDMKQYTFGSGFLHPEFKQFIYRYHPEAVRATTTAVAATALR